MALEDPIPGFKEPGNGSARRESLGSHDFEDHAVDRSRKTGNDTEFPPFPHAASSFRKKGEWKHPGRTFPKRRFPFP
jgi:hypothetical protein